MAAYRYVESSFRLSLSRSSRDSHAYRRFSYGTEAVGAVPIDEPLHKGPICSDVHELQATLFSQRSMLLEGEGRWEIDRQQICSSSMPGISRCAVNRTEGLAAKCPLLRSMS